MPRIAIEIDPDHDPGRIDLPVFEICFQATQGRLEQKMKQVYFGLIVLVIAGTAAGHATESSDAPLDTSGVTAVAISGEASSVVITTAADAPYRATIQRHRTGWFGSWSSAWVFDDCTASSRMWIDGTLLHIDVGPPRWFAISDCRYDINLNLRQQAAVAIRHQALKADLSGEFSAVTIDAKAADVSVSGHAATLLLRGDALRVGLVFKGSDQNEAVTIDTRMLQADMDFSAAPALAYVVTAKASFVDSLRKSAFGAKPSLAITGDFVHATIR